MRDVAWPAANHRPDTVSQCDLFLATALLFTVSSVDLFGLNSFVGDTLILGQWHMISVHSR